MCGVWDWYPQFMLWRRVGALRAAGLQAEAIVFAGNTKLARRLSDRPAAALSTRLPSGSPLKRRRPAPLTPGARHLCRDGRRGAPPLAFRALPVRPRVSLGS